MRSALGLRRIGDIDVSQVMRASETDIYHLQARLRSWGVTKFTNYPLLLRALTHPSMSNWAERILRLPKRSLGPNTLELLGDRVVGTCVASAVHGWLREEAAGGRKMMTELESWSTKYGASSIVASLVGNRGLAHAAQLVGMEELIRWEKPLPPAAHRARLNEHGVDAATGLGVNREVNALAAAYEAVAAAVYLDGGLDAARMFVNRTLLDNPRAVQSANTGLREYRELLGKEIADWIGVSSMEVHEINAEEAHDGLDRTVSGKMQFGIVDLEPGLEEDNAASPLFYAAVVLRPVTPANTSLGEGDLLSVSSHFSIEMARIAAALQAIEMLQGKRPTMRTGNGKGKAAKVKLATRSIGQPLCPPLHLEFEIDGGKWVGDGDYSRVAKVLDKFDVPGMATLARWDISRADELKHKIHGIYEERNDREHSDGMSDEGRNHRPARRRRPSALGSGLICERTVSECLDLGQRVHSTSRLHQTHQHFLRAPSPASDICSTISSTIQRLNDIDRWWQVAELRGYNCVGTNAMRLWSVQRSMRDTAQDRSEVIGPCEARMSNGAEVEAALIGGDGLDCAHYLPRVRKGLVGVGIVVQEFGTDTALQWLTGAEVFAGMRREEKSGMSGTQVSL